MTLAPSRMSRTRSPWHDAARDAQVNRRHAAYVGVCAGSDQTALDQTAREQTEFDQRGRSVTVTGRSGQLPGSAGGAWVRVRRLVGSPLARRLGGVAVLGVVVWRLGVGPSMRAVGALDARSLAVAIVLAALTTVCCAWRWSLVATGLGVAVPLRPAVAACYRSQFLNTATPGGVLGDVHRGVRHGRQQGDTGRGVRSVVWERGAGQVVQAVMALAALSVLPSPLRPHMAWVWGAALVGALGVLLWWRRTRPPATTRRATTTRPGVSTRAQSITRALGLELRQGVLARRTWPLVALASALAVTGHVLTFLVAAHTAGATASAATLVPLAFVVLIGMGIPMNVAGWGPREGVAAWVFGAAGLGADAGLSTAVVYGVLVLVASLPGAGVILVTHLRRRHALGAVMAEAARG
jgi:uncharacterized membrane protein YbhN (UPF0104 family)